MRTPPRLLTEAEVEAGLVHRLEAMRQRRVYLVERAAERQAAAGERRSPASERQPLPRNPEPIPGDGSTPFTGLAQAPEASLFVGAATTSIPIEVPPSRKGMTPKLALIS
ncbi:hypothetical protein L6Q96_22340 [Candidatus Binatia bacterium]|nr:hypothetical protein [Candidatus Binatia bacterium]